MPRRRDIIDYDLHKRCAGRAHYAPQHHLLSNKKATHMSPQVFGRPGDGTIEHIARRRGLSPRRGRKPLRLRPQTESLWWYHTITAIIVVLALCVVISVVSTETVTGSGLVIMWAAILSFIAWRVLNTHGGKMRILALPAAIAAIIASWAVPTGVVTFLLSIIWIPAVWWLFGCWRTTRRQTAIGRYPALERNWRGVVDRAELPGDNFSSPEIPMILGGIGEIMVANRLEKDPAPTTTAIIHGLEIKGITGKTSADIDHLILDKRGAVMIDTKVWGQDPKIIEAPDRSGYMLSPRSSYVHTISTCLYEAAQLPGRPAAILLAISGSGMNKSQLSFEDFEDGRIPITWAYPRHSGQDAAPVSVPTYLVDATDIAAHVEAVLARGRHRKITLAGIGRTGNLALP